MAIETVHIEPSIEFSESVITEVFSDNFGRDFVLWERFKSESGKWLKSPVNSHGDRVSHLENQNRYQLHESIDLANKIVALLSNPELMAKMSKMGMSRVVNELEWKHEEPKLLAAYSALCGTGVEHYKSVQRHS